MAINFPSTAGQPTDGSYTYTVAGISYSWNGESWRAAGAGASATDRTLFSVTTNAAGSPALSYNNNSGVFSYTPPDLSSYLTAETDTLQSVIDRGNTVAGRDIEIGEFASGAAKIVYDDSDHLLWFKRETANGTSAKIWLGGGNSFNNLEFKQTYTNGGQSEIIAYNSKLFISAQSAAKDIELSANGDILLTNSSWPGVKVLENGATNGTALSVELYWGSVNTAGGTGGKKLETTSTGIIVSGTVDATAFVGDGTGITNVTSSTARATVSATNSIASNGVANISLTTPKTYALLSIETSHSAWVTLYSDTASRTADANRTETTDPVAGSGVLAEVITTGSQTQIITPGVICFNSSSSNVTYAKIVNKSGGTANVQVTLTYVQIEA